MPKTFELDNQLPSLPLPTLEHTLERYLDSGTRKNIMMNRKRKHRVGTFSTSSDK